MSYDIEADYTEDYHNEDKHCILCDSFKRRDGIAYCQELDMEISETGNCDFFKSVD